MLAFGVLIFIVSWVLLYTFNPTFVRSVCRDDIFARPDTPPDPVKCLLLSLLISVVASVLWWGVFREYKFMPLIPTMTAMAPPGSESAECAIV